MYISVWITKNLIASAFGHSLLYFRKYLCTYVKTNFGKGKTWKRRGLIVSHVNYDGLVRRLFVVLCVHEVRAMVQQEDSSSIFLLQTSRKSKYIRYRIVASTNTCYYSENQVFGGVTIRVLCSKRGCY